MSTPDQPIMQPALEATPGLPPAPPLPTAPSLPTGLPRRSPGLAVLLSCLPGLGHLYLGLYQRGIAFFLSFAGAIWLADHSDLGIVVAFVWFFALIDAYRQAQFINTGMHPEEPAFARSGRRGGSLGFGVFLTALGVLLLYNQFYPLDLTFLVDWWPLLLVGAGIYMLAKHFLETRKQRELELPADQP